MFDDSDEFIESWCTVCDKQIFSPRTVPPPPANGPSASSSLSASKATEGVKKVPGKFIAPKPPTFKRSKTGTIRAKPPPSALVSSNNAGLPNGPPLTPKALFSTSGSTQGSTSAEANASNLFLQAIGAVENHTHSSPTSPTPSRPPPATIITTLPTPPHPTYTSGLFCSYACAQLEEERSSSALAPLLSSALSFTQSSPLHNSWTPAGGPPSPFFLSNGSDSESGEYFEGVPGELRAGGDASSATSGGTARRGSRSTNTTGSSSDSLQSLWDKDNVGGAAVPGVFGSNHPYHGLKRMTPLSKSKSDLGTLPPFSVRPISALNLVPPPPISPQPIHSPRRSSSTSFTSTGMAFRPSSHSHRLSVHGPAPTHLNPSSYSMSPPLFEPGSAPSTASLYASYAEGFNRTLSVESQLAMYGGRLASPRRGRLFGKDGEDGSSVGGLRPGSGMARRPSFTPSDGSDESSTRQTHQVTPTQSLLHRASSPTRRASSVAMNSSFSSSSSHHQRSDSSTSSLSTEGARAIHPPTSRPPPSKNRLSSQRSTPEPSSTWSWSAMEKMYEVPRLATVSGGGGSSSLGGQKLFYWGGD